MEVSSVGLGISVIANKAWNVPSNCRILQISPEDLYQCFDREFPDKVKQPSNHARNFLEFCSYQAIDLSTTGADYLSNKEFRRLMFDMMLAWESSGVENDLLANVRWLSLI